MTRESITGIFRAYDIRGSPSDELDEITAEKIGAAFARFFKVA
jgi:phosphomannomutase